MTEPAEFDITEYREAIKILESCGISEDKVLRYLKTEGSKLLVGDNGGDNGSCFLSEDYEAVDEEVELTKEEEKEFAETTSKLNQILKAQREGRPIEPVYYPRDEAGKFTKGASTWFKGMPSPNPFGRPRPMVHLYGRFCQVMELTEIELQLLVTRGDLTLADRAAIALALKVQEGAWPQQLEVINREEGKIQEKLEVTVPPQPIRFVTSPGRRQIPEDTDEVVDVSPDLVSEGATGTNAENGAS